MRKLWLVVGGLLALASPAFAEEANVDNLATGLQVAQVPPPPAVYNWTGFYLGIDGGARITDANVSNCAFTFLPGVPCPTHFFGAASTTNPRNVSGLGGQFGGHIGYNYQFNPAWLVGIEADINAGNESSQIKGLPGLNAVGSTGALGSDNVRVNQDWSSSVRGRLGWLATPTLLVYGTGGVAFTNATETSHCGTAAFPAGWCIIPSNLGTSTSVSRTLTGWTAGGGLELMLTPSILVRAEGRYSDYGSMTGNHFVHGGPTADSFRTRTRLNTTTALVGISYLFGAPSPPPPAPMAAPAPPPAAPKVFIVFFDWDKDRITPEGMGIIQQAAAAYKSGAPVQIQVTGYTDRSGSPGYNQRLSERRANNVAKALAALGVPPAQMAVSGRGENDNRVPTADGVREPQNRRVEIVTP